MGAMLQDIVQLRFGPGRLRFNEYCYYQLWQRSVPLEMKRAFVGKLAQQPMHLACNQLQ